MSLLIKALQSAERSKSAAAEGATQQSATKPGVELELAQPQPQEHVGAHDLTAESGFASGTGAASRSPQLAASAVFRAGPGGIPETSRALWLALAGLVMLLLAGGGFYYYLQSLAQPPLIVAPPPKPAPPEATASVKTRAAPVEQAPAPQAEPLSEAPVEEATAARAEPVQPATPEAAKPVARPPTKADAPVRDTSAVLRVTRNRAPVAAVNSSVMAGYQSYMAGDDAAASQFYRQALQGEPRNLDALLGLAAVSARQGRTDEAAAQYLRVLELEPRNAAAQAGLVSLTAQSDPVASESRLKTLLAQQPDAAFLHAALGNLYAEQSQWPAAQQAYFQAYHLDAANPDYAYNLAVSLDQLGKGDLALNYYQHVLELMTKQGGSGLDRAQIEARIARLQQSMNR